MGKSNKNKLRISILLLLIFLLPIEAFAATSRNEVGRFVVQVSCEKDHASYTVTERGSSSYPTAKAKVECNKYSSTFYRNVYGISYGSLWTAYYSAEKNEKLLSATITAYGTTLTATDSK